MDDTGGEILEYQGRPADAFYFSTSNGHTYSNAEIFGGAPLPYLRPVAEADDTSSDTSSWKVAMPLADVAQTLRLAGSWGPGPVESVAGDQSGVRISGAGKSATMTIDAFRNRINHEAVCLVPKRYPTLGSDARPLPQVVPSHWMTLRTEGTSLVMEGRGWGHGVGMVQYGAFGKASRGMPYSDILSFYYGGLRPVRRPEPGRIRVLLASGVFGVRIQREGEVAVEGADLPAGPLSIGGGDSIMVSTGQPLAPRLSVDQVSASGSAAPGAPATFSFSLSAAANVSLQFQGPGSKAGRTRPEPHEAGAGSLSWDAAGSVAPGAYQVSLVATDGVVPVTTPPMSVSVSGPPLSAAPSLRPSARPPSPAAAKRSKPFPAFAMAGGILIAAGALAGLIVLRRR